MKQNRNRIESLKSDIALWELRKSKAVSAYDAKLVELRERLRVEEWFQGDTSKGSTLMRPHRERAK